MVPGTETLPVTQPTMQMPSEGWRGREREREGGRGEGEGKGRGEGGERGGGRERTERGDPSPPLAPSLLPTTFSFWLHREDTQVADKRSFPGHRENASQNHETPVHTSQNVRKEEDRPRPAWGRVRRTRRAQRRRAGMRRGCDSAPVSEKPTIYLPVTCPSPSEDLSKRNKLKSTQTRTWLFTAP